MTKREEASAYGGRTEGAREGRRGTVKAAGDDADTETACRASQGQGEAVANCRLLGPAREGDGRSRRAERKSRPREVTSEWVTDGRRIRTGE